MFCLVSVVNNTVGGWFTSFAKSMSMDDDGMSAELKMFNKMEKEAALLEKKSPLTNQPSTSTEAIDHTGVPGISISSLLFEKLYFDTKTFFRILELHFQAASSAKMPHTIVHWKVAKCSSEEILNKILI